MRVNNVDAVPKVALVDPRMRFECAVADFAAYIEYAIKNFSSLKPNACIMEQISNTSSPGQPPGLGAGS